MVVVSNDTAAAAPLKQKAFQRAEILAPQRDHEFERSKLLTATLPLVTRMFLLGSLGSQSARRKSARRKSTSFSTPTSAALSSNSAISSFWRNSLASTAVCALRQLKLSCSALAWQVWGN